MAENEKLKSGLGPSTGGAGGDPEAAKKLAEAEERMRMNEEKMAEMNKSWEEKLKEASVKEAQEEEKLKAETEARASGRPQLMNLNSDGMLDRKIFIDLSKVTKATVGRKQRDDVPNPTLVLGGVGI